MARFILTLASCFTFSVPFMWSRRITSDNKVGSVDVGVPQDFIEQDQARSSVFVNGFQFGTDEEALKEHFGVVGAIKDLHFQGRGAAVITYEEPSAATRSVSELHETTLDGQSRYVTVKLDDKDDKAKGKAKNKGTTEGAGIRDPRPSGRTIYAYGFDPDTNDDALTNHFGTVGAIEHFHFQSKVAAVITYVEESAAQAAVTTLSGTTMSGQRRYVDVRFDNSNGN